MLGHLVNQFALAPRKDRIPSSRFNRPSSYTTAINASYLYPVYCEEIYPGDIFNVKVSSFARLSTPVVPILDNLYLDYFWFFVPNRLVWNNWAKFNGEQDNPGDSVDYLVPQLKIPTGGFSLESIYDYFGLPVLVSDNTESINVLPLRMYNLIWNEWFRDENLQDSVVVNKNDGGDSVSDFNLLRRNKKKDYFTSCLPTPQKFDGVSISLGTTATVYGDGALKLRPYNDNGPDADVVIPNLGAGEYFGYLQSSGSSNPHSAQINGSASSGIFSGTQIMALTSKSKLDEHYSNGATGLYADLASVEPISITTLRYASILQKFRELQNRGGTRYIESIRTMFGVTSPDARLQRPEYLGGSSSLFNVTPVAQTSATSDISPQGNLSAYSVNSSTHIGFHRSFTEHGFVIGLVQVRADQTYQQGLHKMWSRKRLVDYYFPLFNGLSEMDVKKKELVYGADSTVNNEVLGYQERFSELRFKQSIITGKMRSIAPQPLDIWHLAQYYSSVPGLNSDFIEDRTDVVLNRALAVEDEPQILLNIYYSESDVRPLPTHSIPGMGANL